MESFTKVMVASKHEMGKSSDRPFACHIETLKNVDLRPTRQRLAIAKILFEGSHKHVSAEQVHSGLARQRIAVALATVYNTLHQFKEAGLLREVVIEAGKSYFDTNTHYHHHLMDMDTGELMDIGANQIVLSHLPTLEGYAIEEVDIVVKARKTK